MPYIEPTQESVPFLMLLSLVFAGPSITVSLRCHCDLLKILNKVSVGIKKIAPLVSLRLQSVIQANYFRILNSSFILL